MPYLPHTEEEINTMLQVAGADSLEALFSTIPKACRRLMGMNLPKPIDESRLNRLMDRLSSTMAIPPEYRIFMGAGSYEHFIPAASTYIQSRSEFLTSYTPYQPEISQGTLQAIYEYQTLAARLMGMDVATASHYDGATALTEALLIAIRKTGRKRVAVSKAVHPNYRRVIATYFHPTEYEVIELPFNENGTTNLESIAGACELAAVAIQSPNFFGCIEDLNAASESAHAVGALMVAGFTEAVAYGLLKSPGSLGADIVAGEGQSLGLSRAFGGPGLGMLGSLQAHIRSLPGRIVGKTTDLDGKIGFVLTLAAREQHIRREKATSNICTNNGHCALSAVIYLALLGSTGFRELAVLNHDKAEYLKTGLSTKGISVPFTTSTFNEFVIAMPETFSNRHRALMDKKIIAGLPLAQEYPELKGHYLLCATETMCREDMDELIMEVTS
jgi:glycine dehydrogenase subunit 1